MVKQALCAAAVLGWMIAGLFMPAQASAPPGGPLKIAVIMAATGMAADGDLPAIVAARLAAEQINARGGLLGRPVALVLLDNHSSLLHSKRAAEQAVSMPVAGVVGAIWSSHSQVLAKVFQKAKIPMITPASSHPDITRTGDFIFRTCPVNSIQGKILADFAYRDLGARVAVVVRNVSESYSMTLADHVALNFQQIGGEVAWQGRYKAKTTDFHEIIETIRTLQPDVVFVPGYSRDSGLLIRQAVRSGIGPTFLGGDAWDWKVLKYGREAMEGSYCTINWNPFRRTPRADSFRRRYAQQTGISLVPPQAALTYDAFMLMADAISRAKSADPGRIREALSRTRGFSGVTGDIVFDGNGDAVFKEMPVMTYRKGRMEFVKKVRLPKEQGR